MFTQRRQAGKLAPSDVQLSELAAFTLTDPFIAPLRGAKFFKSGPWALPTAKVSLPLTRRRQSEL
jgi:hypothetical protein